MICFHFIIFEPSETTFWFQANAFILLWFAFISLSLSHQKQHSLERPYYSYCCDLLSFHYLWAIRNNREDLVELIKLLWFAFISLSLSHQKQPILLTFSRILSCDLLSFHYLWAIRNNPKSQQNHKKPVVICFHFIIFEPSETTYSILSVVYKRITDGNRI